jgi:hypothetical protein
MAKAIWDVPSGRSRRWGVRHGPYNSAPGWARAAVVILGLALLGMLAWQGAQKVLHRGRKTTLPALAVAPTAPPVESWERGITEALEVAAADAQGGDITAAEMGVDRAASIVSAARIRSATPAPDLFDATLGQLDRIDRSHPEGQRLLEHTTLARIELAGLLSSLEPAPPARQAGAEDAEAVVLASPRAIASRFTLDPASLGKTKIDATNMPASAEILLPPHSRLFSDNVRVENLTLEGAAQTLDGIRWKNVVFIGTRLRYEGGEVSLQNVRFIRCTFGFTTDHRGARLATAIARSQTSFVLE